MCRMCSICKPQKEITFLKPFILIVDDNVDLVELLTDVLSRRGFRVEAARNGAEALAILDQQISPDLILLDVEMPDMKGPEFLDRLECGRGQVLKESRVVYCSAGPRPHDDRAEGFLHKMTDLGEFVGKIREFVDRPSLSAKHA